MITINLGKADDVVRHFSFPNNFNEVGFMEQTLGETITHYLNASFARDGADVTINQINETGAEVHLSISGSDELSYSKIILGLMECGRLALQGGRQVVVDQNWNFDWRLFLPLGLAMKNHMTLQLLHFPPDYTLTRDQDYLLANTTIRWAELLVRNGAALDETDRFQTIVDIAPIAAPSNAGPLFANVYDNFTPFITTLMDQWTKTETEARKPMMLFGAPVRNWVNNIAGTNLYVGDAAMIEIEGMRIPVFCANHPSYFYNAIAERPESPMTEEERHQLGMVILRDDLIASRWQVLMGQDPSRDPVATAEQARSNWSGPTAQALICVFTWTTGFGLSNVEATMRCQAMPDIDSEEYARLKAKVRAIADELGSLDGRERDKIPGADGIVPLNFRQPAPRDWPEPLPFLKE